MDASKWTDSVVKSFNLSNALAKENGNSQIAPIHLASVLVDSPTGTPSLFSSVLNKAGVSPDTVARGLAKLIVRLPSQDPAPDTISLSPGLARVFTDATKLSQSMNDTFVSTDHLIIALTADPTVAGVLTEAGVTKDSIKKTLLGIRGGKQVNSRGAEDNFQALQKYARDLTEVAEEGKLDPVIGRDNEARRCIRILSRRSKNNPVLIGEPGVGKTAIAELLASRIVSRDVPTNLIGARLWSLDVGALHAGASHKGEFEERLKSVLTECESADNVILFIDEIHTLMASNQGGVDAANILKPSLARGKLRTIGATTLAEYRKHIEKDAAFERRFQQVLVNEPSVAETISILRGIKEKYESHHGVQLLDSALVASATLAHRYLTSRKLPDSAIDLIDEACAACQVGRNSQPEEVDKLERAKLQLEIELEALKSEQSKNKKDESPKIKIEDVKFQIAKLDEELGPIKARWQAEKERSRKLQDLRQKYETLSAKRDAAERSYDLATAADLTHYALPDLQKEIERTEAQNQADEAELRANGGESMAGDTVTPEMIQAVVSNWSGIPVTSLKATEKEKLLKMDKILAKQVVGQPQAVKAVADAIRLSRSGLANADRPVASFLLVGPSGTGKTLLSKTLATFLFDSPDAMIRIDASEYSEKHSISRLIGSPAGYIGYEEGGQLTEYVRRKPYSVVLIDEIEKASREFVQLFLQVLDDGRLTDAAGRVVSFRNTIIVMTSNLGAAYLNEIPEDVNAPPPATLELVHGAIRGHFPPEFINRIDSIIIFNRLTRQEVRKIVDIRLAEIQKRLKVNGRDISIQVDPEALDYLGSTGFSPVYGARLLNRTLQTEVLNPLSKLIIQDMVRDGEIAQVVFDARLNRIIVKANHEATLKEFDSDEDDSDEMDVEVEELD